MTIRIEDHLGLAHLACKPYRNQTGRSFDYLDMVARWAGLPPPPRLDRETLLATVTPMRASFMNESRLLSNRRMKRELKLRLRYPTIADFLARQVPPARGNVSPTPPVQEPAQREAYAKTAAPPPI